MLGTYLGDSYDIVKRFWAESLRGIAPLYSHPHFVQPEIRRRYTSLTTIPVLEINSLPEHLFGLLLDPDTGIPLPSDRPSPIRRSHAPLSFIVQVVAELKPAYLICFDQSFHRRAIPSKPDQLERKREFLHGHDIASFYYLSQAPFLFMADRIKSLLVIQKLLLSLGIPQERFSPLLDPALLAQS